MRGVLDVAVAQIMLQRSGVHAVVGELVAAGMAQHVWMDREWDAGLDTGTRYDAPNAGSGDGSASFRDEQVRGGRVVSLQPPECPKFRSS